MAKHMATKTPAAPVELTPEEKETVMTEYFARGPMCWARGVTLEKCLANLKRQWPRAERDRPTRINLSNPALVSIYKGEGFEIDEMGTVSAKTAVKLQ
jgi:hypothetical protein